MTVLDYGAVVDSAKLLRCIHSVKVAGTSSGSDIARLQRRRLERLLRHVLQKSQFYRSYYGDHGITRERIENVRLDELPVIDKSLVMEHFDELVCNRAIRRSEVEEFLSDPGNRKRRYKGAFEVIETSGSTGTVGIFVYDAHSWNVLRALTMQRVGRQFPNPFRRPRVAFVGAVDGHYAGLRLMQSAPPLFYKFLETSINDPVREIVARLNAFRPDILTGYASGLDLMACELLQGSLRIAPKMIGCSGDQLTPPMRGRIREAFGVTPTNLYAASESISIGAECGEHNGIHLFTDWHCCEIVDDALEPVPSGQPGTMLLTNLYNYTQPLIRYRMNDVLTVDDRPCPCGLALPRVKGIDGRNEEFLWFKKGDGTDEFLHPLMLMAFYVPGLKAFQFIQTAPDALLMKACITRNEDEVLASVYDRMNKILAGKKLQNEVRFRVEFVSHIPNDARTGKYRLVVPWRKSG